MREIHRSPVDTPHKGPATRKMFPFDDIITRNRRHSEVPCDFNPWASNTLFTVLNRYNLIKGYSEIKLDQIENKNCCTWLKNTINFVYYWFQRSGYGYMHIDVFNVNLCSRKVIRSSVLFCGWPWIIADTLTFCMTSYFQLFNDIPVQLFILCVLHGRISRNLAGY